MRIHRKDKLAFSYLILAGVVCMFLFATCQRFEAEQLILLETGSVSDVTYKGCQVNGDILDAGKDGIREHGFCWSQTSDPSLENGEFSKLGSRSTTGTYYSILDSLSQNTTYYIRAYASGNGETVYGQEESFTTSALSVPSVLTLGVNNITIESAESGGEVTSDGGSAVTARGVCWSTSVNPSLADEFTEDGMGVGNFSSSLIRLNCATIYYVRAYATNSQGTSYGNQLEFTTSDCPVGLPVVFTTPVTAISETDAQGGGEVSDEGSSVVTARGVCWSTKENPLITDKHTTNGGGAGSFVSSLTGLECGITYYVRAYATNSSGTAYGSQEEFVTTECPISLPVVSTSTVTGITESSALGGGNVTDDGGASVSSKGICWSNSENPDLEDNYSVDGTGMGGFISTMSGLSCGTTYFVRAYATNSKGTSYGEQHEFRTTNCAIDPPTVSTTEIINITQTSAQGGGDVTDNGGSPVTAKGICWATNQNPSIENSQTNNGGGIGTYTSVMTDLECGITYYVRAYATNAGGTSYGAQKVFETSLCTSIPTVFTAEVFNVTDLTAEGGGEVTDDGNLPITARGVCWSTSAGPEITDSKTLDGEGVGMFTSLIEGLSPGTPYYLRAYATNSEGTAYGEELEFTTWEGSVTDYDGNVYPTVSIGDQVWMQKNLMVTHYADGSPIPPVASKSEWDALEGTDKAYCWFNSDISLGASYGALYSWGGAMNGALSSDLNPSGIQGACPDGWHLPSDSEWKELELFLGMDPFEVEKTDVFRGTDEGGKLKEAGFEHWESPNTGANNESGFTALPGGQRVREGDWYMHDAGTWFWSTTEAEAGYSAMIRHLDNVHAQIGSDQYELDNGNSVRCIKD